MLVGVLEASHIVGLSFNEWCQLYPVELQIMGVVEGGGGGGGGMSFLGVLSSHTGLVFHTLGLVRQS